MSTNYPRGQEKLEKNYPRGQMIMIKYLLTFQQVGAILLNVDKSTFNNVLN